MLEAVGVSAYLGAVRRAYSPSLFSSDRSRPSTDPHTRGRTLRARPFPHSKAHLLTDPSLLLAASSIVTLEARHQSLLNVLNGGSFNPQAFDIALTPQAVLSLAGPFLAGCDATELCVPPSTLASLFLTAP